MALSVITSLLMLVGAVCGLEDTDDIILLQQRGTLSDASNTSFELEDLSDASLHPLHGGLFYLTGTPCLTRLFPNNDKPPVTRPKFQDCNDPGLKVQCNTIKSRSISEAQLIKVESCCPGLCKNVLGDKTWKEIQCMATANIRAADERYNIQLCPWITQPIEFPPDVGRFKLLTTMTGKKIYPHCWVGQSLCTRVWQGQGGYKNMCRNKGWWLQSRRLGEFSQQYLFNEKFRVCCPGLCADGGGTPSYHKPFHPVYSDLRPPPVPASCLKPNDKCNSKSARGCAKPGCLVQRDGDVCWLRYGTNQKYPWTSLPEVYDAVLRCSDIPKLSPVISVFVQPSEKNDPDFLLDADSPKAGSWRETYQMCWPEIPSTRFVRNYAALCCPHICGMTVCSRSLIYPKEDAACKRHLLPNTYSNVKRYAQGGYHVVYPWSADALPPPAPPPMPSEDVCEQCYN